ncbi:MAG: PKD domain-containing protein, partial [Gemmatimonadaceae bacterium]
PTQLRVTGRTQSCPSNQVIISSTITTPVTVTLTGAGDFVATIPIVGTVQCGDSINVRVECAQTPTCFDQKQNLSLDCCEVKITSVTATVLIGALDPIDIVVSGTVLGCISNQVVVSSLVTATSAPVTADPVTGAFSVTLPLTTPIKCDAKVTVTAECHWATPPAPPTPVCTTTWSDRVVCPGCARAKVRYTATPCTGTPPMQPVTLNAIISIPKGATRNFVWDYGDGSTGAPFTISNPTGTGATQFPVSEPPHPYAPGTWNAVLRVVPPIENCGPWPLTVTATCVPSCPSGTITIADPGQCVNGTRTVTFNASVTAAAGAPAIGQWSLGYAPAGGAATGKLFMVPAGQTQNQATNSNLQQTWTYPAPGTYTVQLDVSVVSPGCPNPSLTFTVGACPVTCEVLVDYTPKPVACLPPGGSATVDFVATLSPANPSYTGPYTWEVTKGGVSVRKVTQNAPAVTDPQKFSHTFTGAGAYDVTVTIRTPGCDDPFDTATAYPQIVIKGCCPSITSFTGHQDSVCTWSFAAVVDNPNNAALTYNWTFHDGTTLTTTVPNATHTYPNGGITTGTTTVRVTSAGCPDLTASTTVTVLCFCPTIGTPKATVSGCAGPTAAVTLTTTVSGAAAASFDWKVTDTTGTTFTKTTTAPTTTNGIADGPWKNASSGATGALPIATAGGYAVTVMAKGPAIDPTCNAVSSPASFTIPTCGTTTTTTPPPSTPICDGLLVVAIVLLLLGALVVILGICIAVPWVWIVGAIVGAFGLTLFIIWAIFCAALTSCSLMRTMHCILFWFVSTVGPILTLIAAIFGGLPCGIASAVAWGGWGALYAWLGFIMRRVGCPPTC